MSEEELNQAPESADENADFDENGNWRTLGHQLHYSGELKDLPPEGPSPFRYQPDEIEKFNSDLFFFKQKENLKQAVQEALPDKQRPQPPVEPPFMQNPSIKKEVDGETRKQQLENDIVLLGESRLDNTFPWEHPYIARDYEEKIHEWNQKNERNIFLLPEETGEWGPTLPIKPGNMRMVEVSKEVADEVRRAVYKGQGGYGGRNRFEQLWASLRTLGYSSGKAPTIRYPEAESKEEKKPKGRVSSSHGDPFSSQENFEQWRTKHGANR